MRFVSNWKAAVLLAFAFAGTVNARGCTDREVAAGVGGAILGAVIVDSHKPSYEPAPRRRNCERVVERRCWPVRNYRGYVVGEECERTESRSCGSRYKMALAGNTASELDLDAVAETYKLSIASAEKFVNALSDAQSAQDDASASAALQSICLNVAELKSMGKSGTLSSGTVDCLAKSLDQDPTQTAMMVNSITETARAQDAARSQN